MSNRLFVDSSVLVEWVKNRRVDLYEQLVTDDSLTLCISQIVLSEFTFYLLAQEGGKAPLTLKQDGSISHVIGEHNPVELLRRFLFLDADIAIVPLYLHYMQLYNLLPNDALILATCKLHRISRLASYDNDFATACAGEGIQLIQTVADLDA